MKAVVQFDRGGEREIEERPMYAILVVGGLIAMTIASIEVWIVTRRVRKRMRSTMGRTPTSLEMASLKTWMQGGTGRETAGDGQADLS